ASHVLSELTTVPNFADGQPHSAAISYSNHSLSISLDQQPLGAIQVDLSTFMTLTSNAAYLGFTASTGDFYYATHEITSWSYQHVSSLPDGPIILQIWAETPTSHILQFNGTSNLSYTLQYCDTLNSTSWQDLTNLGPLDA